MSETGTVTAAALIIGNEVLSGKVQEQNLFALARMLRSIGVTLRSAVVVADHVQAIAQEIARLAAAHDWLFTSGGVGPTHDDLTIEAVAQAFGTCVDIEPSIESLMRAHFGSAMTPAHDLMARVPRGCELVTAKDMKWPILKMNNVWVLPGVPEVFSSKLSIVRQVLAGGRPFVSRTVFCNLEELRLVPFLNSVVERFPQVQIGSYPQWRNPDHKTKLTFDGTDAAAVNAACDAFVAMLPAGEPLRVA